MLIESISKAAFEDALEVVPPLWMNCDEMGSTIFIHGEPTEMMHPKLYFVEKETGCWKVAYFDSYAECKKFVKKSYPEVDASPISLKLEF